MSPLQIKELLMSVKKGQTEALKVADFAFEKVICEGSPSEIEEAVQIVGQFLFEAGLPPAGTSSLK